MTHFRNVYFSLSHTNTALTAMHKMLNAVEIAALSELCTVFLEQDHIPQTRRSPHVPRLSFQKRSNRKNNYAHLFVDVLVGVPREVRDVGCRALVVFEAITSNLFSAQFSSP